MKHSGSMEERCKAISRQLLSLPHKILRNFDVRELLQLVLQHLAHEECFDFQRAAFFVDNPDFDHLKGVAGYYKKECTLQLHSCWENPHVFKEAMRNPSSFLAQVQNVAQTSFKRRNIDYHSAEAVKKIGERLGMKNPRCIAWEMKHGNHGLFLYEAGRELSDEENSLLSDAVSFLSFCHF